jgi:riboflavin synthase
VNSVRGNRFEVLLIPETLQRTQLAGLTAGGSVNLEADVLGKYVARLLSFKSQLAEPASLDLERLKRAGFA